MRRTRKPRTASAQAPAWLKAASAALLALLLCATFAFARAYTDLSNSIHRERVESVQQISSLISKKLNLLKERHEEETATAARFLSHSGATSMAQVDELLDHSDEFHLLSEDGRCLALDGSAIVVSSSMLSEDIGTWTEVRSEFCTVQSKGDFWVFAAPVENVSIDGVEIAGLLKVVDSQQYADVAILPVFNGQGASYVVDTNGVILLRPSESQANEHFKSHNFLRILTNDGVDPALVEKLQKALLNCEEEQVLVKLQDDTWLLQTFPDNEGRNIVMAIPVSITAQATFASMKSVIALVVLIVASIAALSLLWLYHLVSKSQMAKIESARASLKSDFLTKMSHDIRTPLNAIVGSNELALRSLDDPATAAGHLERSKKSGEYLIDIINDMLDMNRLDGGKMTLAHEPFLLSDVLDSVIALQSGPAEEKGVTLREAPRALSHTSFVGDATRIKQCLVNLVSNAVKFTPEHGDVALSCEEVSQDGPTSRVRFIVRDSGAGMSEAFMKRLFEPFEQERSSLTSAQVGSGLGLAIVHSLVELMGGTVEASSTPGKGSTFIMDIPLERAATVVSRPASAQSQENLRALCRGKRVLLAEDNEMNREIIVDLLSDFSVEVDTVRNGAEAVEAVTSSVPGRYALVLMDIQMPVMTGLEAASAIRASEHPDAATIPIVALSAGAFEEDVQNSLRHGMQDHLAKPLNLEDIENVFRTYLNR